MAAVADVAHDVARARIEQQAEAGGILFEVQFDFVLNECRGEVATGLGRLDRILFLGLPDRLVQHRTLAEGQRAPPGGDRAVLGAPTGYADIDACDRHRRTRIDGQFDDRGLFVLFDDACRDVGGIVAVRTQGGARIGDRLIDDPLVITRAEPDAGSELHGVDMADYVCRQCVVQPDHDVIDIAMGNGRRSKQQEAD